MVLHHFVVNLAVLYSIGAYFDNLVLKLSVLSCCYNKTWQPLYIAITVNSNILGYFLLHIWLNMAARMKSFWAH